MKYILIDIEKTTEKHFEVLKEVYPTAIFIQNKNDIKNIKSIQLVSETIFESTTKFFGLKINIRED